MAVLGSSREEEIRAGSTEQGNPPGQALKTWIQSPDLSLALLDNKYRNKLLWGVMQPHQGEPALIWKNDIWFAKDPGNLNSFWGQVGWFFLGLFSVYLLISFVLIWLCITYVKTGTMQALKVVTCSSPVPGSHHRRPFLRCPSRADLLGKGMWKDENGQYLYCCFLLEFNAWHANLSRDI